jgi:hypothetical protein
MALDNKQHKWINDVVRWLNSPGFVVKSFQTRHIYHSGERRTILQAGNENTLVC